MDKVTKRQARNKASAPKMHTEMKHSGGGIAPSGHSNPVDHGPRASGASPCGSGGNTCALDAISKSTRKNRY